MRSLPPVVPGWEPITWYDLALACAELYGEQGWPVTLEAKVAAVFGDMLRISVPSTFTQVKTAIFRLAGNTRMIHVSTGVEDIGDVTHFPVFQALGSLIPTDYYPPFQRAAASTNTAIKDYLGGQALPRHRLYVGHSEGGAVATILYAEQRRAALEPAPTCVTFGCPRMVRSANLSLIDTTMLWRFFHPQDLVTAMPNNVTNLLPVHFLSVLRNVAAGDYVQTGDGIRIGRNEIRYGQREIRGDAGAIRNAFIEATHDHFRAARHGHNSETYAANVRRWTSELVRPAAPEDRQMFILPFELPPRVPNPLPDVPLIFPGLGSRTPEESREFLQLQQAFIRQQQALRAAQRNGPGGWAAAPGPRPMPAVTAAIAGGGATMRCFIPQQFRFYYAKNGTDHWIGWMGRLLVQRFTKAECKTFIRRANSLLRLLQCSMAVQDTDFPDALLDYLAKATQDGNGFIPTLPQAP